MLIIEEPDEYNLPDIVKDMPQVEMIFQHIDLPRLHTAAKHSGSKLTTWVEGDNFHITNTTTDRTDLLLVNMQYMPVLTMEAGKWYRWRMVMSSAVESMVIRAADNDCRFQLLSKDGIFLTDAPRNVLTFFMTPGNRADIAVRCDAVGSTTKIIPVAQGFNRFVPPPMEMPEDVPKNAGDWVDQPEIMTINVVEPADSDDDYIAAADNDIVNDDDEGIVGVDLEPFDVDRPCYLVDLRDVDIADDDPLSINFRCNSKDCNVNDIPWHDKDTYMKEYPLGSVQEIELASVGFHPYHQHVNPFQIHSIVLGDDGEENAEVMNWYKEGDFHDTFQYPTAGTAKIRFAVNSFTGHMVMHCHILTHEDLGMMAQYNLLGEEGTIWEGSRDIDPTCILPPSSYSSSNGKAVTKFEEEIEEEGVSSVWRKDKKE